MTCVMERPRKLATSSKARNRRRKQSMIFFSGSPPGTWKSRVNEVVPVYSQSAIQGTCCQKIELQLKKQQTHANRFRDTTVTATIDSRARTTPI
jgi:hypothetical protein